MPVFGESGYVNNTLNFYICVRLFNLNNTIYIA